MEKPEYPKYTREQKLNCKLTDNDIKTIKELHFQLGWSLLKIAKEFKVSYLTIKYWCLSPEQRKIFNKEHYRKYKFETYNNSLKARERLRKFRKRKRALQKEEIRRFEAEMHKKYYYQDIKKTREKERIKKKKYYSRPEVKKRIKQRGKEYRSRPEVRQRMKQYGEEYYSRPEVKKHIKQYMKEYHSRPEAKRT